MAVSGNAAVAAQTKGSGYFRILVWNVYFRDFRNIADLQTLRVRKHETGLCETVYRAVKGDHDAQEKLLQYYDAYISALSTVVEICSDGTEHQYVCEDQKAEIQTKYLEALSKCKVIK